MIDYSLFTACDEGLDARYRSPAWSVDSIETLGEWVEDFFLSLAAGEVPREERLRQLAYTVGHEVGMEMACHVETSQKEWTPHTLSLRQTAIGAFLAGVDTALREWYWDAS